jgi:uncharacterized protein (DUF4415 family)
MKRKLVSDLEKVSGLSDDEVMRQAVSDPDAQPTDEDFWLRTVRAEHPAGKRPVTIRLSPAVLDFFKRQGPGYQTRINAVLERYVELQDGR